ASASAWSTAAPARSPSRSVRAPRCKAAACRLTRPSPCWSTSAKARAPAPPAAWSRSIRTPSPATSASPARTPRTSTTRRWLFPPRTCEVQLDEKWSFVAKKEAHIQAGDPKEWGDAWDHTAVDPEQRLLLAVVPGKRTLENCRKVVQEVKRRTGGRTDLLLTSDEHAPYATAIEEAYHELVAVPRRPGPGRPANPKRVMPAGLCYATVCKRREKGRVVEVKRTLVFGLACVLAGLAARAQGREARNKVCVGENET